MTTREINKLIKEKNIDLYVYGMRGTMKTKLKKIETEKRNNQYFIFCVYDGEYMENMSELWMFGVSKEGLLDVITSEIRLKNYVDLTKYN